jgi:hypothetical protein
MPIQYRDRNAPRPSLEAFNRSARIEQFEKLMRKHPGAAPNGTGTTGLMSGDSKGYSELLNRQKQYIDDTNAENGRGPAGVRDGGVMATSRRPSLAAFDENGFEPGGSHYGMPESRGINHNARSAAAQRERAGFDAAIDGARLGNARAASQNALFDSESLPYGTPEDRTRLDLTRKRAVGDFGREEGDRNQRQSLEHFFDPAHQGKLNQLQRRGQEDVSHEAGEQRATLFGRDQIAGSADVGVATANAGGRGNVARYDALSEVLRNPTLAKALEPPVPGQPEHPLRARALAILDQVLGAGGGGGEQQQGGGQAAGSRGVITRADIERMHREQGRGRTLEQMIRQAQSEGYVVR